MASILVVLIILGCAVYQYFKGSLVSSLVTLMIVVWGSVVSFGYFEFLSDVLFVRRGAEGLMPWAQMLSFAMLFVFTFAVLQTAASRLISKNINLGLRPEQVGRVCCGILLGLMLSGLLLTAVAMGPLSSDNPYQRFDSKRFEPGKPNVERPDKRALLNADGFVTGWFSLISRGGMSGEKSFAALHPRFLDQLYLNRLATGEVSIITGPEVIEVPREQAVRLAPEGLQDTEGRAVEAKTGCNLTIVKVGMRMGMPKQKSGRFTLSQVRLICKQKEDAKKPFAGKGINIYPIGYLKTPELLEIKRLNEPIEMGRDSFTAGQMVTDFAFWVPENFVPVLVEFKQNNIAQVPAMVAAEQRPAEEPTISPSGEPAPSG
ncbi:MAG: CvpA family protein [Sedimentisphaerales bacterium]|nr:CvpA family protein [Sedimentisphaerales bacterium]